MEKKAKTVLFASIFSVSLVLVMLIPVQAKIVLYQGSTSVPKELESISGLFVDANITLHMINSSYNLTLDGRQFSFEAERCDLTSFLYVDEENKRVNGKVDLEMHNTIINSDIINAKIGYLTLTVYIHFSNNQLEYELTKTMKMPLILALITKEAS